MLDEPVSAMDPDGARSLYKLVDKIHKQYGTTIIAVEHRVDYVLTLRNGYDCTERGRAGGG